ncbi:hypothetical protein BDR07DRAFT_1376000 [Suillus spraguei]|nr:hypothetical protein BDR07DRAFT_1376000 [Suillus spraguei]
MSELEESLYALDWNNSISVAVITLILYDYMLQFEKEERRLSDILVSSLQLLVPAVDPDSALLWYVSVMQWSYSVYFCLAEVQEITITPSIKYCTAVFHIGPMPAIYASIFVICYDIFLVVLAIIVLGKHLKERKELKMKPNTYVVMIVRYHIIYFVIIWDTHAKDNCTHSISTTFEDCACWTSPPTLEQHETDSGV